MKIEIVLLGSGTSSGVPVVGKKYSDEYLANSKNHRLRQSILIKGPEGNLLVDAGADLRCQLLRENIDSIDAVLITHTHADHIMGLDDLRPFSLFKNRKIPIYSKPNFLADIQRIFSYAFQQHPHQVKVPRYDLINVPEILEVCGLKIHTFTVLHGKLEITAFRLNNFVYITDVSHIPIEVEDYLKDLDIFMLDAVRIDPHPNHIHFEKAIDLAKKIAARQTYFIHLGDDYDHDKTESLLPSNIHLGYDGLRLWV